MPDIVVRPLTAATIAPAAQLLAGSMRDNPLHRRVFGGDEARLEPLLARAFARLLRRQMGNGLVLAAYDEDALVGVAAMVAPGHCQPRLQDKLGMLMVLARAGALWRLPRIQRWLGRWKRHDPDIDHWHLGPAAVDRTRQGQGIGAADSRSWPSNGSSGCATGSCCATRFHGTNHCQASTPRATPTHQRPNSCARAKLHTTDTMWRKRRTQHAT